MPNGDPSSSLETGATAALSMPGGAAGAVDQQEILKRLLAAGAPSAGAKGGTEGLFSFGPQPTTPSMPPTFQPQPGQPLFPGYEHSFGTTGERQRSQRQAAFYNAGRLVKSFTDLYTQQKQRHAAMLTERLMSAMQGLQEAQASGNQEAVKHNAQIINDLMSDPKNRKVIEKAFDINFFGKSKGKDSPEQAGLLDTVRRMQQDYQSGKTPLNPYAQRFQQMMPQRQQISPEAQARAQAIQMGLEPSAAESLKAQAQEFKTIVDNEAKFYEAGSKLKVARMLANLKDQNAKRQYEAYIARTKGMSEVAHIRVTGELDKVRMQTGAQLKIWENRLKTMQQIAGMNDETKLALQDKKDKTAQEVQELKNRTTGANGIKQLNTEYNQTLTQMRQIDSDINNRTNKVAGLSKGEWSKFINSGQLATLKSEIDTLNNQKASLQGRLDGIDKRRQMLFQALQIPEPQIEPGSSENAPINIDPGELPPMDTKDIEDVGKSIGQESASQNVEEIPDLPKPSPEIKK